MCTENLSVSWCARVFEAAGLQCWGTLLTSCSSLKTGLIALVDSNRVVFRITTGSASLMPVPGCGAGQADLGNSWTWDFRSHISEKEMLMTQYSQPISWSPPLHNRKRVSHQILGREGVASGQSTTLLMIVLDG